MKERKEGRLLGERASFADIGKTVVEYFGCDPAGIAGTSFLGELAAV